MKILPPLELTDGYDAPSTDQVTPDLANLDSHDFWKVLGVDSQQKLPETLEITATIKPVPLLKRSTRIHLLVRGKSLQTQNLYLKPPLSHHLTDKPEDCQLKAVRVLYHSSDFDDLTPLEEGELIYEKPFSTQTQSIIHEERRSEDKYPRKVYGYGGIYKVGMNPNQVEQIYFELFEGLKKTEIALTRHSQWLKRGIHPFHSTTFQGQKLHRDPHLTYEKSLNLGAALNEGFATLRLKEPQTKASVLYASTGVTQPQGSSSLLTITFKQQKGEES